MRDATRRILNATEAEIDDILALDDHLDRLRKRPRAWDNRELHDLPNIEHTPNPHSGSIISL